MPARVTRASAASQTRTSTTKAAASSKKSNGAEYSAPSTLANTSRKRARAVIKEEEASDDEPDTKPPPPSKRTKKSTKPSSKTKPKPEPDLEAGAKLASALVSPGKPKPNPYNLTPGTSPYPTYAHPTPAACHDVYTRLSAIHGAVQAPATIPAPNLESSGCGEVPSVLDALIRTRLSANTNNANSNRAFRGLVSRFGVLESGIGKGSVDWDAVRRADVADVFEAIKTGGLAGVKSRDIHAILELVHAENVAAAADAAASNKAGGSAPVVLSLDHLHGMSSEAAFDKLLGYPGVGPKTASCVLLFCMQRPSFAVDTHVFRLTRWLGWTPSDAEVRRMGKAVAMNGSGSGSPQKTRGPPPVSRNTTYAHLDVRVPDELKYPLHYLLIRHGKTCPSCMAKRDGKVKEAWGGKKCPIADLKRAAKGGVKRKLGEDGADTDEEEGMDDDDDDEADNVDE